MEQSEDSVAMLHDDKAERNGPDKPTGFQNLAKVLSSCELCSFEYNFNTKTHLHPKDYPPLRCDYSYSSLRPRFFANYTFKHEARKFYTNDDKRYV